MKLLQINIFGGVYLEELVKYVKSQNYDILCFQEITGGERFQLVSQLGGKADIKKFPSKDCRQELARYLPEYQQIIDIALCDRSEKSYVANGILCKKTLKVINQKSIHMGGEKRFIEPGDKQSDKYPYKAIAATLKLPGSKRLIEIITGHFSYHMSPYDTDQAIRYARKVYDYARELNTPFIITGDFNIDWRSVTVGQFNDLATNLVSHLNIKNTLNPNIHRGKHLFPEGLAVDQMFISRGIDTLGFRLIREDLSDHYGLELEFELEEKTDKPIAMNTYFDANGDLQDYREKK